MSFKVYVSLREIDISALRTVLVGITVPERILSGTLTGTVLRAEISKFTNSRDPITRPERIPERNMFLSGIPTYRIPRVRERMKLLETISSLGNAPERNMFLSGAPFRKLSYDDIVSSNFMHTS